MSLSVHGADLADKKLECQFTGTSTALINALRRCIMSEVPYIATYRDDARNDSDRAGFVVRKNTGKLHNDMLCDRLALVPIHLSQAEVDTYIPGSIVVELQVKNESNVRLDVTSKHLRVLLFDKTHPNSNQCFPRDKLTRDWVLITRLYPGQEIDVTMTLEKATASTHAAFCVSSVVASYCMLDEEKYLAERARIVEEFDGHDDIERKLNLHDTITRKRLIKLQDGRPMGHHLVFESVCGLSPADIITRAAEILASKFKSSSVSYEVTDNRVAGGKDITYMVHNQGHTFGSVLQDICIDNQEEIGLDSIGYYQPHPRMLSTEDKIIVRVVPNLDGDPDEIFSRMKVACSKVTEELEYAIRSFFKDEK